MAVALDVVTDGGTFTGVTNPFEYTHTPTGTPRGVVVMLVQSNGADRISGVTYGGTSMTEVTGSPNPNVGGEVSNTYMYFLGSSVPTGAQTVSVTNDSTGTTWSVVSITVTADDDTEITVSTITETVQADPQITLDTGSTVAERVAVLGSGLNAPANASVLTGYTDTGVVDFGTRSGKMCYEDTAASGSQTIGWTAASDDVVMIAGAITQVAAAGGAEDPFPFFGGGYFPTEG